MTPWTVELLGEPFDLRELIALNALPDVSVEEQDGRFYLRSEQFNTAPGPREVHAMAVELVGIINGIAQTKHDNWESVTAGGVTRVEDGKRNIFLLTEPIRLRIRARATGYVTLADGTAQPPAAPRDSMDSILGLTKTDAAAQKALRLFGSREHNWANLYKVYEVISADVGGRTEVVKRGWASDKTIRLFKHTADSVGAVGDEARHGVERTQPPPVPMLLAEADALVSGMLRAWLKTKV
jgi:hypothetical protein